MFSFKQLIADNLSNQVGTLSPEEIFQTLEYPPNVEMGDIALPCFKLSKALRKPPVVIAQEIVVKFVRPDFIDRVESVSGYLNFFLNKTYFISHVLESALSEKENFGSRNLGQGKTVVIDFSAPNIAKPFHVGHLRSTVIGRSLYQIFQCMGYRCVGINHLGDWGTQFGKLIVAYLKWGDKEKVEAGQIKELVALYVRFHDEAEKSPELEDEARAWFTRIEQGDREALDLWRWFMDISLQEYQKVYDLLDVKFDSYAGESFYNDKMGPVVQELKDKNLLMESDGAQIVNLEKYDMPPCIILKKDGSSLYATRDITAALYRKREYNFEKCLYVTGAAQALHFQQWFKTIELMGYEWVKNLVHVPFGIVSIEGEKLSTRKGKVVLLEEILSEAIKKASEIIENKNPDLPNKHEIAEQIGVGAVVFSDLSSNRIKDVSFSWDEVLNFDGETGPYVQYTHARACSVLQKSGMKVENMEFDPAVLGNKEEYQLITTLYLFPEKLEMAMMEYEPSIITRYMVDLAQKFNRFYHEHSILNAEESLKKARLALVMATRIALVNGLKLIGLKTPERI